MTNTTEIAEIAVRPEWTSIKPSTPGYYWYRRHANQRAQMLRLERHPVYHTGRWSDELLVSYTIAIDEPGMLDGEWIGPLEEPR